MKQYVIDELRLQDYEKIKSYLDANFAPAGIDGLYCVPLETTILTAIQKEHADCRPHYFAIDIEENLLSCELLVRTRNRVRCDCICYATETQRNWLINLIDGVLSELAIKV